MKSTEIIKIITWDGWEKHHQKGQSYWIPSEKGFIQKKPILWEGYPMTSDVEIQAKSTTTPFENSAFCFCSDPP